MSEVPTTGWTARHRRRHALPASAPFAADWQSAGSISHVFTHFSLELEVYRAEVDARDLPAGTGGRRSRLFTTRRCRLS